MNAANEILTSEAYCEHANFWKLALRKPGGGFQLRQHQRAYALPPSGRIEGEVELSGSVLALIDELSGGRDLGALVVIAAGVFQVLSVYSGSPVVQVESPLMEEKMVRCLSSRRSPRMAPFETIWTASGA